MLNKLKFLLNHTLTLALRTSIQTPFTELKVFLIFIFIKLKKVFTTNLSLLVKQKFFQHQVISIEKKNM